MKQRNTRPRGQARPQTITKVVTHIRLLEVNPGKLAALDALAPVYLALCQQYITLFCTEEQPDKFHAPVFTTPANVVALEASRDSTFDYWLKISTLERYRPFLVPFKLAQARRSIAVSNSTSGTTAGG